MCAPYGNLFALVYCRVSIHVTSKQILPFDVEEQCTLCFDPVNPV